MHYNVNSLSSVITQMLYFYKSEGGGKRTEQVDVCFYTAHTHQRQKRKDKMNKITKRALSGVPAVFVAAIGFTSSVAF